MIIRDMIERANSMPRIIVAVTYLSLFEEQLQFSSSSKMQIAVIKEWL